MLWFSATVVVMVLMLFARLPWLERAFMPTIPVVRAQEHVLELVHPRVLHGPGGNCRRSSRQRVGGGILIE
jgi:hypothetical protein